MSEGLFIGARLDLMSRMVVANYVSTLNIDAEPLPLNKLHVTIMYSKVDPKFDYPLITTPFEAKVTPIKLVYIGNAIAILLNSPFLSWRFALARASGLRSKWSSICPHLSLYYDPPKDIVLQTLPQPDFPLFISEEYMEPLKDIG